MRSEEYPVSSIPEEPNDATVPQDLELLADLRPNVAVLLVQVSKPCFERIHVVEGELGPEDLPDACEHVRHPSARPSGRVLEEGKRAPGLADILWRQVDSI